MDNFWLIGLAVSLTWACLLVARSINDTLSRPTLQRWAAECGYTVIQAEYRLLCRGPFTWKSSKVDMVFYLQVLTPTGIERRGWVKFTPVWPFWIPGLGKVRYRVSDRWET